MPKLSFYTKKKIITTKMSIILSFLLDKFKKILYFKDLLIGIKIDTRIISIL